MGKSNHVVWLLDDKFMKNICLRFPVFYYILNKLSPYTSHHKEENKILLVCQIKQKKEDRIRYNRAQMENHHDPHNNPKRAPNANYFLLSVDVLRSGRFASWRIFQLMAWVNELAFQFFCYDIRRCGVLRSCIN